MARSNAQQLIGQGGGPGAPTTLAGVEVDRVVWASPESGWAVVRGKAAGIEVCLVGPLAAVRPGEVLDAHGQWTRHAKFGEQLEVASYSTRRPATVLGIRRYLEEVPEVGPRTAELLVAAWGERTLEVVWNEPDRLEALPGVGPKRARAIREGVITRREETEAVVALHAWGVAHHLVPRILRLYGPRAPEVIREDPYRLVRDVEGVAFRTADAIALSAGRPVTDPERLRAGALYAVEEEVRRQGATYVEAPRLVRLAAPLLGVAIDLAQRGVDDAVAAGDLVLDAGRAYPAGLHRAEVAVAKRLRDLTRSLERDPAFEAALSLPEAEGLTVEQAEAVVAVLGSGVSVLTGGPGTGKTHCTRIVVQAAEAAGLEVALCAPTGRAARRLAESTGRPAATIHRLLKYSPVEGWGHHRRNPLGADLVLVDETSMVDLPLAYRLLDALPDGCRVVFVGDADQLPPVGPGQLMRDLVESGAVPVARLTRIFRQEEAGLIVQNAHRVLRGEMPERAAPEEEADCLFMEVGDPERAADAVVELVARRIPERHGLDPARDVWALTPMHKGPLGTKELNRRLQAAINPSGRPIPGRPGLRVGDRVMQVRNSYELGVFNGDPGIVLGPGDQEGGVRVDVDGREVTYSKSQAHDLALAYACTVHKFQGSQAPAVVLTCHRTHAIMLRRELLYTAMTRPERLLVVVGQAEAVRLAVRRPGLGRRASGLAGRLQRCPDEES